jgi:hypothetical protein
VLSHLHLVIVEHRPLTYMMHVSKNHLAHRLFSPNQWIENVSYITMTNQTKSKHFHTIIEVNNLVLNDYDRIIFQDI